MNADQALAELALDLQPSAPPGLTSPEVAVLLGMMATTDAAGVAPDGTGWVPTYDRGRLTRAVYRGLQAKAAKVSGKLTYTADGQTYNAGELGRQLREQLQTVAMQLNGSAAYLRPRAIELPPFGYDGGGLPLESDDDVAIGILP